MRIFTIVTVALFFCFLYGCSTHHVSKVPNKKTIRRAQKHAQSNSSYKTLKVGSSPLSPMAADFNGDGYNDIAVVSHGKSQLKIFWGGPNRTFRPGPVYGKKQVGYHPGKITLTDWNRDGLPDIILACEGIFQIQYWENTGKGFKKRASTKVWINAKSIQCTDLDNDGYKDIVIAGHQSSALDILWGKRGLFSFSQQKIAANPLAQNVEIGDWNKDGKTDIFWVEKKYGSVVAAINLDHRKFKKRYIKKPGKPQGMVKDGPEYIKLADLNEDRCMDASVSLEVGKACLVYYGDCKGGVISIEKIPAPSWGFSGLAATGRGPEHPPMLALGEEMKLFIAKKTATGWKLTKKPAGSLPRDFSLVDMDDDGTLDLLIANTAGSTIAILYGPF